MNNRDDAYESLAGWTLALNRLLNPFRNYLVPASMLRWCIERSDSPLIAETLRAPGGWPAMEIIYQNNPPLDVFDQLALRRSPLTVAIRNRRRFVVTKLADWIQARLDNRSITILGVGAGPGRHVLDAIARGVTSSQTIRAYLVDRDTSAFETGRRRCHELGLDERVQFIQGDARHVRDFMPQIEVDIAKLIGLIEYLDDSNVAALFTAIYDVMVPGGELITHGLLDPQHMAPFFERVFGLRHIRRSGSDVERLLRSAGFRHFEHFQQPLGIFPVVATTK